MLKSQLINSFKIIRRSYAENATAAVNSVLKLNFALPHQTLYNNSIVKQVNLPTKSGRIGILPNHIPIVEQLLPGVVEIEEENSKDLKKIFISGGFVSMQPDSTLCITAVEAFPLESFSKEKVQSLLEDARKNIEVKDETVSAIAQIQVDVLEELQKNL